MKKEVKKLHSLYEEIYTKGKETHFLKYSGGKMLSDAHQKTLDWLKSKQLSISKALDFGCGEADFLGHLPAGTDCTGIDFSEVALNNAKKRYPHIHLSEPNDFSKRAVVTNDAPRYTPNSTISPSRTFVFSKMKS